MDGGGYGIVDKDFEAWNTRQVDFVCGGKRLQMMKMIAQNCWASRDQTLVRHNIHMYLSHP